MREWKNVEVFEPTVILRPEIVEIAHYTRIDSFCKIEGGRGVIIGEYVHIASSCHLNIGGGTLRIGDHCFFASGARVVTGGNRTYGYSMSACSPKDLQVLEYGEVTFAPFSGCLAGAIVLPGCHFGEGAVAAAGSVVTKPIPAWEIWAGNPAKFMRERAVRASHNPPTFEELDADLRAAAKGHL